MSIDLPVTVVHLLLSSIGTVILCRPGQAMHKLVRINCTCRHLPSSSHQVCDISPPVVGITLLQIIDPGILQFMEKCYAQTYKDKLYMSTPLLQFTSSAYWQSPHDCCASTLEYRDSTSAVQCPRRGYAQIYEDRLYTLAKEMCWTLASTIWDFPSSLQGRSLDQPLLLVTGMRLISAQIRLYYIAQGEAMGRYRRINCTHRPRK